MRVLVTTLCIVSIVIQVVALKAGWPATDTERYTIIVTSLAAWIWSMDAMERR